MAARRGHRPHMDGGGQLSGQTASKPRLQLLRERGRAEEAAPHRKSMCAEGHDQDAEGVYPAAAGTDLVTSTRHAPSGIYTASDRRPRYTSSARDILQAPDRRRCASPSLTHVYSPIRQLAPTHPTIVGTNIPMKRSPSIPSQRHQHGGRNQEQENRLRGQYCRRRRRDSPAGNLFHLWLVLPPLIAFCPPNLPA